MTARHRRPRRFVLVTRQAPAARTPEAPLAERRSPGEARERVLPDFGEFGVEATDDATLRRFLEAMRRWQAQEQDEVLAVTPEAVRRTVEYVLSRHFAGADEAGLGPTTDALRAYLDALAEAAAAELDTGRSVVTQMVARAKAAARDDGESSLTTARQTARTARDLLSLLEREGWRGSEVTTP